jgi:hypothetical protein
MLTNQGQGRLIIRQRCTLRPRQSSRRVDKTQWLRREPACQPDENRTFLHFARIRPNAAASRRAAVIIDNDQTDLGEVQLTKQIDCAALPGS